MDIHKFYPEQEPQPEEFDEAFVDTTYNLMKRFGAITQPGIVPAMKLYQLTNDLRWQSLMPTGVEFDLIANGAFAFNVGPGLAFDHDAVSSTGEPQDATNPVDLRMNRIFISPTMAGAAFNASLPSTCDSAGNSTPQSTGAYNIPLLPGHVYSVYVRYLSCVDTAHQYSVDPNTGQLGYTHWVDGYQILAFPDTVSINPADVYLGAITTGVAGITSINKSGRTYLSIPGMLVTANLLSSLAPAGYTGGVTGTSYNFVDHVNAVADITAVNASNPHGTTIAAIPGLLARFGAYSDQPEDFFTNGIIDNTSDITLQNPGPYWASVVGSNVQLKFPVVGQSIAIDRTLYDGSSAYYAEVYSGSDLVLQNSGASAYCQFSSLRAAGYYFIYGEAAPYTDTPGLAIKALQCGATGATGTVGAAVLQDMLYNPQNYLNLATQYPFAIVYYDGAAFVAFTADPQTGYAGTFLCLDMRKYGTIGKFNINHDRRSYTGSYTEVPQLGILTTNDTIYADQIKWHIAGNPAVVTDKPVRQDMVKKAGRIKRVTVYSDNIPVGSNPINALVINITKNGITNSIFSALPMIVSGRTANASSYAGAGAASAVLMSIVEQPPQGEDLGQIDTTANYVAAGDRLQLLIPSTGAPGNVMGGNDLIVMIYIE